MNIKKIAIAEIQTGDRFRKDYGDLSELKQSIENEGLINPITVCTRGDKYELMAGGRRLQSYIELGKEQVEARVYEGDISELELRTIELAENVHRKDLHYTEKVMLIAEIDRLQKEEHGSNPRTGGWSLSDTAKMVGSSKAAVSRAISLAEAIQKIPELGKCKNEHEANKMQDKIEEDIIKGEMAKRASDRAEKAGDSAKRILVSQFIVADMFEGIKKVKNKSVDIVEIDPPFGVRLDSQKKGGDVSKYNEIPMQEYNDFIHNVMQAIRPKLKDDAWVICWFGISDWLDVCKDAMEMIGLKVCPIPAIWIKQGGQCMQPDYNLANSYETFLYGRQGNAVIENRGRKNIYDTKTISPDKKVHPTEKPVELLEDILSTFGRAGQSICVPFLGSGNTLLAANNLGMSGVGFDLAKENKDNFIIKVELGLDRHYRSL